MSARPPVPLAQAVLGLSIFATIALPLTPSGWSLLDLVLQSMRESPVGGLTLLIMFGSPHLFGLALAIAHRMRDPDAALFLVQIPLVVLQGMVTLTGVGLLGAPRLLASFGFIGFAFVTGLYYVYASAESSASGRSLGLRWHVRWGALLIAGLGLFLRLQVLRGVHLGVAVDAAIVAAVLLLGLSARPEAPAPERS